MTAATALRCSAACCASNCAGAGLCGCAHFGGSSCMQVCTCSRCRAAPHACTPSPRPCRPLQVLPLAAAGLLQDQRRLGAMLGMLRCNRAALPCSHACASLVRLTPALVHIKTPVFFQIASRTNFTSLATPTQVGSGRTALVTLLHEGAPSGWGGVHAGWGVHGSSAQQRIPVLRWHRQPSALPSACCPAAAPQAAMRRTLPTCCSGAPSSGGQSRVQGTAASGTELHERAACHVLCLPALGISPFHPHAPCPSPLLMQPGARPLLGGNGRDAVDDARLPGRRRRVAGPLRPQQARLHQAAPSAASSAVVAHLPPARNGPPQPAASDASSLSCSKGEVIPWAVIEEKLRSTQPYEVFM